MGQLIVRGLADEVIARLKRRAAENGRSTEAEHRAILEAATRVPAASRLEQARRFQQEVHNTGIDSGEMIRQLRDERALRR